MGGKATGEKLSNEHKKKKKSKKSKKSRKKSKKYPNDRVEIDKNDQINLRQNSRFPFLPQRWS